MDDLADHVRPMPRLRIRSLRLAVLAATAIALVCVINPATSAAYTATGSGHPGRSTVPFFDAVVHPFSEPYAFIPARHVYRSSAYGGTQLITVYWSVYQVVNTGQPCSPCQNPYHFYSGTHSTVRVGAGQSASFHSRRFNLDSFAAYTFNLTTIWRSASGRLIGRRDIRYVNRGDYKCYASGQVSCDVEPVNGRAAVYVEDV